MRKQMTEQNEFERGVKVSNIIVADTRGNSRIFIDSVMVSDILIGSKGSCDLPGTTRLAESADKVHEIIA
jgi:hypothetical protein